MRALKIIIVSLAVLLAWAISVIGVYIGRDSIKATFTNKNSISRFRQEHDAGQKPDSRKLGKPTLANSSEEFLVDGDVCYVMYWRYTSGDTEIVELAFVRESEVLPMLVALSPRDGGYLEFAELDLDLLALSVEKLSSE